MTLKIAEIGLNHMGRSDYFYEYVKCLSKKKIDAITIQIIKKSSLSKSYKSCYLNDKKIIDFIKFAKRKFKFVGVVTDDIERLEIFKKLNVNFYKLTSGMLKNTMLIKKILNSSGVKKIYLSTGFSSISDIKKVLKKVGKKKINLIHTSFEKKITKVNLNRINLLKEIFKLPVAYGNHSKYFNCISSSVFFDPCAIFFYVKLNKNLNYPDKKHAVSIKELDQILYNIKENEKLL
tara:strand:- start:2255 stop:2956 length:702 start_codon:yes stop_codon:yes gene_type:complete